MPDAEQSPVWPKLKALLEPAAALSGCEINEPEDTIWAAIEDGKIYAAFTLRMTDDNVEIRCAGGTGKGLRQWVPLLDETVTEIARAHGRKPHCRGRWGWAHFATQLGWQHVGDDEQGLPMFEKEV